MQEKRGKKRNFEENRGKCRNVGGDSVSHEAVVKRPCLYPEELFDEFVAAF